MSDTRTVDDKFKATFGYITSHALDAIKHDVGVKLDGLEKDIGKLPDTTPAKSKSWVTGELGRHRYEISDDVLNKLERKQAYAACVKVAKQADRTIKEVAALAESEKRLPELKNIVSSGKKEDLKKLDDMVAKLGDKVTSAKNQGFLIAAIRARYDIDELSGDLSSRALPRFYALLGMVPPEHAMLNDKLKRIHREKKNDSSDAMGGQMNINAGSSSPSNTNSTFNNSAGKKLKLKHFDATTLHEIGHTVDEAYGFMTSKRNDKNFGGWADSNLEEVVGLICGKLKESLKDDAPPDKQLAWIARGALISPNGMKGLDLIMTNADVMKTMLAGFKSQTENDWLADKAINAADTAVEDFLRDNPTPIDMSVVNSWVQRTDPAGLIALSDHKPPTPEGQAVAQVVGAMLRFHNMPRRAAPVVKEFMKQAQDLDDEVPKTNVVEKLKTDPWLIRATQMAKNFWECSQTEIAAAAIGGKVYQFNQARWWSYDVAARDSRVSDYQFRSPLEWFAEVYAVYQLGKLSKNHPCAKLIDGIKDKQ